MTYKEFLTYLEENSDGYAVFMEKATAFQEVQNKKRPAKSRWKEAKVQKAVCEMWKKSMQPLYDKIKNEIKSNTTQSWIDFIENNNVLETINDGITDLSFNEDI